MQSSKRGKPNLLLRKQRLLRGWSFRRVADELHKLCERDDCKVAVDAGMVWKWESGKHTPSSLYRDAFCRLYQLTADQLGFIDGVTLTPSTETQAQSATMRTDDAGVKESPTAMTPTALPLPALLTSQGDDTIRNGASEQLLFFHTLVAQESEPQDMDRSRRRLLQYSPHLLGATFISPSSSDLLNASLLERLARVLTKPSSIDGTTLKYLETCTANYWRDRHSAALASYHLLSYVLNHLLNLVVLLESPLLPTVRERLCAIASETAQLIGELFFDMNDINSEKAFKNMAIIAAQEANRPALEAVARGRMSFVWTYSSNIQEARISIQEARRLAAGKANSTVCAWLAAVEAEIQSMLPDRDACLHALTDAERLEAGQHPDQDSYWLSFDPSLLAGYQGICFQRLACVDTTQRTFFLEKAHQSIKDALTQLHPTLMQRQPTLVIDLAGNHVQQHNIEEACMLAIQAVTMTRQIKSQINAQRLLTVRYELEPWKDTPYVKNLDEQMASFHMPGWYRGNITL